jgi:hypothetical protein
LFTILTGTTAKQWVFMIVYAAMNTQRQFTVNFEKSVVDDLETGTI